MASNPASSHSTSRTRRRSRFLRRRSGAARKAGPRLRRDRIASAPRIADPRLHALCQLFLAQFGERFRRTRRRQAQPPRPPRRPRRARRPDDALRRRAVPGLSGAQPRPAHRRRAVPRLRQALGKHLSRARLRPNPQHPRRDDGPHPARHRTRQQALARPHGNARRRRAGPTSSPPPRTSACTCSTSSAATMASTHSARRSCRARPRPSPSTTSTTSTPSSK